MSFLKFIVDSMRTDIRVIDNPYSDEDPVIWDGKQARSTGYQGQEDLDCGFFYCPYIPLIKNNSGGHMSFLETLKQNQQDNRHFIKTFEWGSLNFSKFEIELTTPVTVVRIYSDVRDLMDAFDMMTYEMPMIAVTRDCLELQGTWHYKNKKSVDNLVPNLLYKH